MLAVWLFQIFHGKSGWRHNVRRRHNDVIRLCATSGCHCRLNSPPKSQSGSKIKLLLYPEAIPHKICKKLVQSLKISVFSSSNSFWRDLFKTQWGKWKWNFPLKVTSYLFHLPITTYPQCIEMMIVVMPMRRKRKELKMNDEKGRKGRRPPRAAMTGKNPVWENWAPLTVASHCTKVFMHRTCSAMCESHNVILHRCTATVACFSRHLICATLPAVERQLQNCNCSNIFWKVSLSGSLALAAGRSIATKIADWHKPVD